MARDGPGGLAAALLLTASLLGGLSLALTWGEAEFGFASADATLWRTELRFFGDSGSVSWFDDDLDGEDGIGAIRAAGPTAAVGAAAALVAGGILFASHRPRDPKFASLLGAIAGIALIAAAVLFVAGVHAFLGDEDARDAVQWQAGLVVAVVGGVVSLAGSALAAAQRGARTLATAEPPGPPGP